MLEHNPLRLQDLDKDALILVVAAIRTLHDEAPDSAGLQSKLMKCVRKPLWAPPMHQVIRIGPGFEHEIARCIDDARGDNRPIVCVRYIILSSMLLKTLRLGSPVVNRVVRRTEAPVA